MINGFEIKCQRCGNTKVDIKGTVAFSMEQGATIKVKFTCLLCGYKTETITVQNTVSNLCQSLEKPKQKYMHYIYKNGTKYRKIGRFEIIKEGAMQSWAKRGLQPIQNPETVGDIPANFSLQREFYNPI